ncbi:Major Facilitator Superfamily protein [Allorhodopirellula heiligendammensis]|uniref:Major Facilitator Superfamily protein n=2 Tax=Allorhodopirellula heiligendammensis TaxID=2714739 RepID=A0A5C6BWU5_9BACT|nr:Major Facilitator Superfamily protein [Allorhodopirellula heiligendammensis]
MVLASSLAHAPLVLDRQASPPPAGENRNLTRSMADAAFFGGMVGCGETYFSAFALAIGLGETASGLVASIPLLVGGTLQLISPLAIKWLGSFHRWIVTGAVLQAAAFLPLAWAAWSGSLSLAMMLLIASVYWAAGLAIGPAWNTWIEHVVPAPRRTRFFARRSRLQQICTFVSLISAGLFLQWTSQNERTLLGFAALFFVAGVCRLVSAVFLHRTNSTGVTPASCGVPETGAEVASGVRSTPIGNSSQTVSSGARQLLTYLVLMQVFVQISGPFFTPYMLKQLSFGYGTFVMLISVAFISKVLSMSFWGRIAERSGATRVLWIGGVGLVPLSALWIISDQVAWLLVVQLLSGVFWAAYELGFFLMFFETMPPAQRTQLLTYYNFANTLAVCVGATTGAAIMGWIGYSAEGYHTLFGISSSGRLFCLGLLAGIALPHHSLRQIRMRFLSIRPGAGSVVAPILASAEEE